jgi:type IX secretion system PorP/SprF family membrane protein
MKKILTLALVITASWSAIAQQDAHYTMYRFNGLYLNPAYAGSREVISATAIYRHQWVNIPGAPRTGSVGVHSPLRNNNVALGLIYTHDRLGVTRFNHVVGTFAYRVPVGKKKNVKLSFGIQAGATNYNANLDEIKTTTPNDPNFTGVNQNLWVPVIGAGFYAYSEKFFIGVASPNLLQNSYEEKLKVFETGTNSAHQYIHMNAFAGYVFSLGKKVKFMPSVLMKYVPNRAPVDFDFNATFIFIDRVWLGAGYRLMDSYNFMAAFNITKQLRIGYAYDLTVSPLSNFNSGTHEVMLGYDFDFDKKRIVNPRYVKYF